MDFNYSARIKTAICLMILLAIANSQPIRSARFLKRAIKGELQFNSKESRYDRRFAELRKALPAGSVVGYLADPQPEWRADGSDSEAVDEFYLTRYALAPAIVTNTTKAEFVVGNFHVADVNPEIYASKNLTLDKNLGDGVLLLRGASK